LRAHWVDEAPKEREVRIENAQKQTSHGPFLLRTDGHDLQLYVPQPSDSVYLRDATQNIDQIYRLQPQALSDVGGNWPMSDMGKSQGKPLLPVQLQGDNKSKPVTGPRHWSLKQLLEWRKSQRAHMPLPSEASYPPHAETRTHVALKRDTRAAEEGKLFQTTGLDYGHTRISDTPNNAPFSAHRWHLGARFSSQLSEGLMTLGGERRPSWLANGGCLENALALPQDWPNEGGKATHWLCLTLITPALLDNGWADSTWSGQDGLRLGGINIQARLISAALPRWQGISGWNLKDNQPKASRRMVPAGSVYWFELQSDITTDTLQKLWLAPISSCEQDRADGFGLVVPAMVPIPTNTHTPA
jgi:CRISPR-associated protein Cmr3